LVSCANVCTPPCSSALLAPAPRLHFAFRRLRGVPPVPPEGLWASPSFSASTGKMVASCARFFQIPLKLLIFECPFFPHPRNPFPSARKHSHILPGAMGPFEARQRALPVVIYESRTLFLIF
jgi:hypothetical protein